MPPYAIGTSRLLQRMCLARQAPPPLKPPQSSLPVFHTCHHYARHPQRQRTTHSETRRLATSTTCGASISIECHTMHAHQCDSRSIGSGKGGGEVGVSSLIPG